MFEGTHDKDHNFEGVILINTKKKVYYAIVVSFFIIAGTCYCLIARGKTDSKLYVKESEQVDLSVNQTTQNKDEPKETTIPDETAKELSVHVCGAVAEPGVYEFYDGARIMDGIEAAGGFLEGAAEEHLNLAQKLADEQKVYVPTILELQEGALPEILDSSGEVSETDAAGKININTASAKKLTELPGIGEKRAEKIITYREQNGLFQEISDLTKVDGISVSIFEGLKDMITIAK